MSPFTVYLIMILDNVKIMLSVLASVFGFILIMLPMAYYIIIESSYGDKKTVFPMKKFKLLCLIALILTILATFVPDTKQATVTYLLPKIINNEKIQIISQESLNTLYDIVKNHNVEEKK